MARQGIRQLTYFTDCPTNSRPAHDRPLNRLIGDGVVWDNHACMPLRPNDDSFMEQLDLVRSAGVNLVTLNVAYGGNGNSQSALAMLRAFHDFALARPDDFVLVCSVQDIEAASSTGRLGLCFDIEGMDALDGSLDNVERFYLLGVRWMLATYNRTNAAGGGCLGDDRGLTPFGRSVVARMNEVGMVCCGTHCGYRTAREIIDASASPVIFSHSNPRAVWDHPRNIPDDLMMACAARSGVIGINGFGPFLGQNDASTETFVRHVEYALDLVGDDHVGIALDYVFDRDEFDQLVATDPATFPPAYYAGGAQMVEPWRLPEIARLLLARGHSAETLGKLFGGNHLRIAREVWR